MVKYDKKVIMAMSRIRDYICMHGITSMTNKEKRLVYKLDKSLEKRRSE